MRSTPVAARRTWWSVTQAATACSADRETICSAGAAATTSSKAREGLICVLVVLESMPQWDANHSKAFRKRLLPSLSSCCAGSASRSKTADTPYLIKTYASHPQDHDEKGSLLSSCCSRPSVSD